MKHGTQPQGADARFRMLEPHEGAVTGAAIRAAYGNTYDLAWVYDAEEVGRRLADGTYVAWVAEEPGGELLCHVGLGRHSPTDRVGHSGQAVTMPAARGQHLFTATKRRLIEWAREEGLAGMYGEATAAHPYSERANVELGAHETGFLLGWIPGSVSNDASEAEAGRRQSAVLFYTKTNEGHERQVFAPGRHRGIVEQTLHCCRLRGEIADPPGGSSLHRSTDLHCEAVPGHNIAILTAHRPGDDLDRRVAAERDRLFSEGLDAIFLDLPMEDPATAHVADHLEALGVFYSGIFPNTRADGDVLRMQSLNRVTVRPGDVAVVSDHGRELLDYVLADLAASHG
jgi:serine/threonine-protein kinase RsbW